MGTARAANVFEAHIDSHDNPSAVGATLTPGNNTMGTAVIVLDGSTAWSGVTGPGYEIEVEISGVGVSSAVRDLLLTMTKDDAGGTDPLAATDWLVNLSGAQANATTTGGVVTYRYPIEVPNGCSLFAKASVNNATVGTARVCVRIACQPTHPWLLRVGTSLVTYGATPASSSGTAIASTTTEPAWTEIGTLAADLCYLDFGFGLADTATQANVNFVDIALGDAGTKRIIIQNARVFTRTDELIAKPPAGQYCAGVIGEKIYARVRRLNGAADTGESILVYGVTGTYAPPTPYTVAGTVTIDGDAASNGGTVEIFAVDADDVVELVATATIAGGAGAFTANVPDNTRDYFASYDDGTYRGRSALDTPV